MNAPTVNCPAPEVAGEGILVAIELESPHDVRVAVVAAEYPVHRAVGVVVEVHVGTQLEQLITLARLGLEPGQ